ncbi:MAG TPA: hypothetical protein VJ842_04020 [Pyrinomonadaceae bacterium]|nr:hypothetical protein [Pyrinomonadaceae bacterium]
MISEFNKNIFQKDGYQLQCKTCRSESQRALRKVVIAHYSEGANCCACCGENNFEFMTIDHINGGGSQHRKKAGSNTAQTLMKEGLPDGYRVLCFNCNISLGFFGYCPHQNTSSEVT